MRRCLPQKFGMWMLADLVCAQQRCFEHPAPTTKPRHPRTSCSTLSAVARITRALFQHLHRDASPCSHGIAGYRERRMPSGSRRSAPPSSADAFDGAGRRRAGCRTAAAAFAWARRRSASARSTTARHPSFGANSLVAVPEVWIKMKPSATSSRVPVDRAFATTPPASKKAALNAGGCPPASANSSSKIRSTDRALPPSAL